jgi:hypothetical protein
MDAALLAKCEAFQRRAMAVLTVENRSGNCTMCTCIFCSRGGKKGRARLLGLAEAAEALEALETVEERTEEVRVECSDVLEVTE